MKKTAPKKAAAPVAPAGEEKEKEKEKEESNGLKKRAGK